MPVMEGWGATQALKASTTTRSIPIIAVTSKDEPVAELRDAGFAGYVLKPITPTNLLRVVDVCLAEGGHDRWLDLAFARDR